MAKTKKSDIKWVINSYNGNTDWIREYTDNVVFYDKKDQNVGYNIYDYMDFIVKNYDNLPEITLFGKDNMLERHITKKEFDKLIKRKEFTPLLTQDHKTYMPICFYDYFIYHELNNSWYLEGKNTKHISSYEDFADKMGLPSPEYLAFAPGGCYIVPKEHILKHPKEFYQQLKDLVDHCAEPGEAHCVERALYTIWR